jgi:outer membrane protein assembly factor BamB
VVRIDAMPLLRHAGGIAVIATLCGVSVLAAENWTRFRGPNGLGVSSATNLPIEFGPDKNVRWKAPLPPVTRRRL